MIAASGATRADELSLTADALARLETGEALVSVRSDPEGASGLVEAAIIIDAAPQSVWVGMTDCARSMKALPQLKGCRVMERAPDGSSDVREHVVQWIWPLPAVRTVFRSTYTKFSSIAFERVEGDLAELKGDWRLRPHRGGVATLLFYRARLTPGWPVPGPLVRSAIAIDVPATLRALRREVTGRD